MIAKGDLGQELSRRRTTAQGRGKQERTEEQRNEAMPKPWAGACTAHISITAPLSLAPPSHTHQKCTCPRSSVTCALPGQCLIVGDKEAHGENISLQCLGAAVVKPQHPLLWHLHCCSSCQKQAAKAHFSKYHPLSIPFFRTSLFLQILENCFVSMETPVSDTKPFKIC